jgi:hypothetical protein
MTLAIGFKGSEGVVLAADSRVTLQAIQQFPGAPHPLLVAASYDNATKLLRVQGQDHVAAVTFNAGAIGLQQPRTATACCRNLRPNWRERDGLVSRILRPD